MSEEVTPSANETITSYQTDTSILPTVEKDAQTRRRKSFNVRKSLLAQYQSPVDESWDAQDEEIKKAADDEKKELEAEIESLRTEKDAWNSLLEQRKKHYRRVVTQTRMPLVLNMESCADDLSEEDKLFLSQKPDYEAVIAKMRIAEEMMAINMHMKQKTAHIEAKIIKMVKDKSDFDKSVLVHHYHSLYK